MRRFTSDRINLRKATGYAIIINSLQIAAAAAVALLSIVGGDTVFSGRVEQLVLSGMALVVIWGAVLDIREAYAARRIGAQSDMLEDACGQLSKLNLTLRAQRHDFMNHLQVVFGLIELEEYAEAKDYIETVYGDIQKVGRALKTAIPAVNALLAAKLNDCTERGIRTELDMRSAWQGNPVSDWEMCRVLGNLIDNAMEALKGVGDPCISIHTGEDLHAFTFTIANNGPRIAPENLLKIFQQGFTTKSAGHGMGLSIVRDILEDHGGEIRVESDETSTRFTGIVPKQANQGA